MSFKIIYNGLEINERNFKTIFCTQWDLDNFVFEIIETATQERFVHNQGTEPEFIYIIENPTEEQAANLLTLNDKNVDFYPYIEENSDFQIGCKVFTTVLKGDNNINRNRFQLNIISKHVGDIIGNQLVNNPLQAIVYSVSDEGEYPNYIETDDGKIIVFEE